MALTDTQLYFTELHTLTLSEGTIARFTTHDVNLVYLTNTYYAVPITRSEIKYHSNLKVDKLDVSFGIIGVTIGTDNWTIPEIVKREYLRNARHQIRLIDWNALSDYGLLFDGYVTDDISYDATQITLKVGSVLDKLAQMFPKLIFSKECNWQLYGTECGLSSATYQETGVADVGSSTTSLIYDQTPDNIFSYTYAEANYHSNNKIAHRWFAKGYIQFTSGNNNGIKRTITQHNDGHIKTMIPFPETVAHGDTFEVYPGCNKSARACSRKWDNYIKFGGFEHIPKATFLTNRLSNAEDPALEDH